MSQAIQIWEYLRKGGKLTALDALMKFNCLRLSARIQDLKREGKEINGTFIATNSRKKVKQYWVEKKGGENVG